MDKHSFLFIFSKRAGGGAERAGSVLCSALAAQGHEVHCVQYIFSPEDYPLDPRVIVHPLALNRGQNAIARKFAGIAALRRIFKETGAEFITGMLHGMVFAGRFASIGLGRTYISAVRSHQTAQKNRLLRWARGVIDFCSTAVFVQTRAQRDYYPRFMRGRVFVVPNAVSPECFDHEAAPEAIRRVVSVGRFTGVKNFPLLLRAFADVCRGRPDMTLTLYGQGPLAREYTALAEALGIAGRLALPGFVADVPQALSGGDLFVLPSDHEGMPNALMEAMAVGLPCISTDCLSGPADLIDEGETGLLVPVGDARALAAAMQRLAGDPQAAARMGRRARAKMRAGYQPDAIARRFADECVRHARGARHG